MEDFVLFNCLRERFEGDSWNKWPRPLAQRDASALDKARADLREELQVERVIQFAFYEQWKALHDYCRERAIKIIGDVAIFVNFDSADVWSQPHLFYLNERLEPTVVSGVPPDAFSETGQRWGNPLYDWRAMERDRFDWWVRRLQATLAQVDLARIDHFRGFAAYWRIPAKSTTAQTGRWVRAPGAALFKTLQKRLGALPFIAEDLGVITPDVEQLRDDFGLPGMRVLQFAFGGDSVNPFLPHNYVENSIAYTGTHDNDTSIGWYRSADANTKKSLRAYANGADRDPAGTLMRLAWSSVARIAIAPVQDVLRLGSKCRFNVPGCAVGNWSWRMREGAMTAKQINELAAITSTYGRATPRDNQ
jgi:4-alpha-glucanotransferase